MRISLQVICILLVITSLTAIVKCDETKTANDRRAQGSRKLPKDPLFMTELDLENLYDQWEESDDDKLPPDELELHKRPSKPNLDLSNEELMKDPEKLMRASKKGKTVMSFVTIAGNPTKSKTEELTQRWQLGLTNNHMKCERYVIADNRAIFVFHDGSLAYEAKDFLVDQPEVSEFSIDGRTWHGKGFPVEYPNAKKRKVATEGDHQSEDSQRRVEL